MQITLSTTETRDRIRAGFQPLKEKRLPKAKPITTDADLVAVFGRHTSRDEFRPALYSVNLLESGIEPGKTWAVASDGFRLACAPVDLSAGPTGERFVTPEGNQSPEGYTYPNVAAVTPTGAPVSTATVAAAEVYNLARNVAKIDRTFWGVRPARHERWRYSRERVRTLLAVTFGGGDTWPVTRRYDAQYVADAVEFLAAVTGATLLSFESYDEPHSDPRRPMIVRPLDATTAGEAFVLIMPLSEGKDPDRDILVNVPTVERAGLGLRALLG